MPGATIHLAAAREFDAGANGLFFIANLAPDFTDAREIKTIIHLRNEPDRASALRALRETIDTENTFELGWLLHLFADWRWDTTVIPDFEANYKGDGSWFIAYRAELGRLSHSMYHNEPWSREVWAKINAEDTRNALRDMRSVTSVLPVPLELDWYREHVLARHARNKDAVPQVFSAAMALEFAAETAKKFREWL
jgi:hypothetical protein